MTGDLVAGRYRMQRRLGSGGMAVVFLAKDCRLEREVAIKRLHTDPADEVARRFEREAKVGASLNHPNIVGVYDTLTDDEGVLIVMEYVPGHTLRDEIARGRMEPGRALDVLSAVAGALDHAHGHGVVHRDVKPANVLIDDGRRAVKLADLGIATAAERTRITKSGALLGTASYMAPERLDGGAGGPAVDVYALAAVAFEMLSGRKAVVGATPLEIARRVATAPPADLREVVPEAPVGAAEALKRGLAKDPGERPQTAGELVRELSAAYAAQAEESERRHKPAAAVAAVPAPELKPEPRPAARAAAPPTEPPQLHRGRRRPGWLGPAGLAAAGVAALAVLAIVLASSGGGDKPSHGSVSSTAAKQAQKKKPRSNQPSTASAPQTGSGSSATPAAPATGGGSSSSGTAPTQSTPDGAVVSFYRTSIDDPHAAWEMGTDRLHSQFNGSEASFAGTESTLTAIDFPQLSVDQNGNSATVTFKSVARHTSFTDHCHGTIDVVRGAGGWLVDHLNVAGCTRGSA